MAGSWVHLCACVCVCQESGCGCVTCIRGEMFFKWQICKVYALHMHMSAWVCGHAFCFEGARGDIVSIIISCPHPPVLSMLNKAKEYLISTSR